MTKKYNLFYYVYRENINRRKIEKYNVLDDYIVNEIVERTKTITCKTLFAEEVKNILRYYFWCRSEHEIILTSWPPHVKYEEILRLNNEIESYQRDFNTEPHSLGVNLTVEEKVDIYSQVMLNWDIFINYVWENLR